MIAVAVGVVVEDRGPELVDGLARVKHKSCQGIENLSDDRRLSVHDVNFKICVDGLQNRKRSSYFIFIIRK